jgi:hypothetical protein
LETVTSKQEATIKEMQMAYNKDIHMRDEANLTLNSQYRTDLEQVEARYTESCKRQQ